MTQQFHSKSIEYWKYKSSKVISLQLIKINGKKKKEKKIQVHTKIFTQAITAAVFLKAPKWNQSKCPSTEERMNEERKYSEQANPGDRK